MKKSIMLLISCLSFAMVSGVSVASFDRDNSNGSILVGQSDGYVTWVKRAGNSLTGIASLYMTDMNEIAVGDIDGDGNGDVLVANTDGYVRWVERNGTGFADRAAIYTSPATTIDIGDMDGDLNGDFIASRSDGYSFWGERSDNDLAGIAAVASNPRFAKIGNIDGDSNGDVWVARKGGWDGYVTWYERSGNDLVGVTSIYIGAATALAAGDMDFDGHGDAVVATDDGYITWLEYDGAGSLAAVCDANIGAVLDIAMGDIDADGNGDIVLLCDDGYVVWYERDANALVAISDTFVDVNAVTIALGNLDGDGFNDLAVGSTDGYVRWYEASGSSFGDGVAGYDTGASIKDVQIASTPEPVPFVFDDFEDATSWDVPVFQYGQSGYGDGWIDNGQLTLQRDPVAGFKFYAVFAEKTYGMTNFLPNTYVHFRYKLGERLIGSDMYATVYLNDNILAQVGLNGDQLWKSFEYCVPKDIDDEIFWGSDLIYGYGGRVHDFRVNISADGLDSIRYNDGWSLFSIKYEDDGGGNRKVRIFVDGREIVYRDINNTYPDGVIDNDVNSNYTLPNGSCSLSIQFGVTGDGNLYSNTTENGGWGFAYKHAFADNTPAVPDPYVPANATKQSQYMDWDYVLTNPVSREFSPEVKQLILEDRLKVSTAVFLELLRWQDAEKFFGIWTSDEDVNDIRVHSLGSPNYTPMYQECYDEAFSTEVDPFPGSVSDYNEWQVTGGAVAVANYFLSIVNRDTPNKTVYCTAPNANSAIKISARVGSQTDQTLPGAYGVGIVFGNVCAVFHPDYSGGAFRFQKLDGTALSSNFDMGFTPAKGVLHPMEVIVEKYNGQWHVKVTVKNASGSEVFNNSIALSDSCVNGLTMIGFIRTGDGGGNGVFDDLEVAAKPYYTENFPADIDPFSGAVSDYNEWTVTNGTAAVVSNIFHLINRDANNLTVYATVSDTNTNSAIKISAEVGSQADSTPAGQYCVGIVFGNVCAVFHPDYSGGAFRFQKLDGTALSSNFDMGFTPAKGILHPMKLIIEKDGSQWNIKATVENGAGSESFTNLITLSSSDINGLTKVGFIRTGDGGGNGVFDSLAVVKNKCYTEKFQDITIGTAGAWTDIDLSSYGVDANQVVEIGIRNSSTSTARDAGVRTNGSSLARKMVLHAVTTAGWDMTTMMVKTDANKKIEAYAASTSDVHFYLVGIWNGGDYTERYQTLTVGTTGSWADSADLSIYGVGINDVIEVMASNMSTTAYVAGIRTNGSSLERKLTLHASTAIAAECLVMQARADANKKIEVWKDNSSVTFTLLGYWTTTPGIYTEKFVDVGKPTSSVTWYTRSLSGQGVPAYGICEMLIANASTSNHNNVGVRKVGSSLSRLFDIHESSATTARECGAVHVMADGSSQIQQYLQNQADTVNFYLLGYWN
ncbi:MAG: FG-GAP repeat domain-containing protein [Sedimentisphaerales bacterium]